MFGILTDQEIDTFLSSQLIGHLGYHADGVTSVVPMSYSYNNGAIYAHSREGNKISTMRSNPRVCFQVDDTHNLSEWKSVVCQGIFEELVMPEQQQEALRFLNSRKFPMNNSETMHLGADWPFPEKSVSAVGGVFFRIRILEKTGRFEKSGAASFYAS